MGRYAGHLPHENPHYRERHDDGTEVPYPANFTEPANAAAALAWAEAERALTLHRAPELAAEVAALHDFRREEDRVRQ
jgi:hypothetical protein